MIIVGLGLFAYFGDPAGGNENAPGGEWAIAIVVDRRPLRPSRSRSATAAGSSLKAAGYGVAAGNALRALGRAHEADARLPARERRHDALALGVLRARDRGHPRLRAPAGLARHRPARALGRHRLGREPDRQRDPSVRCCWTSASSGRRGTWSSRSSASGSRSRAPSSISLAHEAGKGEATAPEAGEPSVAVA